MPMVDVHYLPPNIVLISKKSKITNYIGGMLFLSFLKYNTNFIKNMYPIQELTSDKILLNLNKKVSAIKIFVI